jgi:hypothetical protein
LGTVLYACDILSLVFIPRNRYQTQNKFIEHYSHANALDCFASLAMTNDRTRSAINPPTVNAGSTPRRGA